MDNSYLNPVMETYECDGQMDFSEYLSFSHLHRHLCDLKAVLLMREKLGNKHESKEDQMHSASLFSDSEVDIWIDGLKEEIRKTPEEREAEAKERQRILLERDFFNNMDNPSVSCTTGDYSPSCPWNAPGMSVRDFI